MGHRHAGRHGWRWPGRRSACSPVGAHGLGTEDRPSAGSMCRLRWTCSAPGKYPACWFGCRCSVLASIPASMSARRLAPVIAAVNAPTRTMAVPAGDGSARAVPGRMMSSATWRPARLAGPARATGRRAPVTGSVLIVASPTAHTWGSEVRPCSWWRWHALRRPPASNTPVSGRAGRQHDEVSVQQLPSELAGVAALTGEHPCGGVGPHVREPS